jgi:hypothetical protein
MASTINASTTSTSGLIQTADASGVLELQSNGTTGLTVNANASVTVNTNLFVSGSEVKPLILGTAQTATGTRVDFTGIPSWAKRITVILYNSSTTGTSIPIIRVGTSGGFVSTGYLCSATSYAGGSTGTASAFTTGFGIAGGVGAGSVAHGIMTLINISGTIWVCSYAGAFTDAVYTSTAGGRVDASGTVNSIRLTTVNGTDTFDAGTVNIMYE